MSTNLLDLAKKGNPDAISTLMNSQLQSKGITAKVALKDSYIYVLLESETIPDQKVVAPFVFQGMNRLAIEVADSLQVYGKQRGEKRPSWSQVYSLNKAKLSIADKLTTNTQDITTEVKLPHPVNNFNEISHSESLDTIKTHLDGILTDEKMTVKLIPEDKLLKVIVETDQFLNGSVFAERIYNELKNFDLSEFKTVGIYKQKLKSNQCFQIQAFSLTIIEQEISEPKLPITHTQGAATTSPKTTTSKQWSQKDTKPKIRVGRVLGIVAIVGIAGFIIIRLLKRIVIVVLLSPALGSFSVLLGTFFLWRSYSFLMFLFQTLLTLLVE